LREYKRLVDRVTTVQDGNISRADDWCPRFCAASLYGSDSAHRNSYGQIEAGDDFGELLRILK
jgi:hypothetical protein